MSTLDTQDTRRPQRQTPPFLVSGHGESWILFLHGHSALCSAPNPKGPLQRGVITLKQQHIQRGQTLQGSESLMLWRDWPDSKTMSSNNAIPSCLLSLLFPPSVGPRGDTFYHLPLSLEENLSYSILWLQEAWNRPFPCSSQKEPSLWHCDLGLLTSWTMRHKYLLLKPLDCSFRTQPTLLC